MHHRGDIDLQHIGLHHQMTDIFAKALGADKCQQFLLALDLEPLNICSLRGREAESRKLKVVEEIVESERRKLDKRKRAKNRLKAV